MKEREICFYSIATHLGGAERSLLDLVTGLRDDPARRYRPWLLLPGPEGSLVDALRARGIEYDVLPMPSSFLRISRETPARSLAWGAFSSLPTAAYAARLGALLRRRRPALIHTTGLKCHALAALTQPLVGLPVLWHLRDILRPGLTTTALRGLRRTLPLEVIANSKATAESLGADTGRITVIHNGLDPARYRHQPNRRFHEALGASPELPLLGIVGVLARWKGQLEFLRLGAELLGSGVDARFAIVGDRIYDTAGDEDFPAELRAEAIRLGLQTHVHFAGFVQDSVAAINGLDVLVHASNRPEPFGRVILEAMACGVPVVAAAAGGVLELVEDGRTGLLFPPGDFRAAAAQARRLLTDAPLRAALVEAAHARFSSAFTLQAHIERVIGVYDSLLGGAPR